MPHDGFSDRISVTVTGQGPDILLIAGLGASAAIWDETTAHLRGAFRLHQIQIRGFAGTPALANASGAVLAPVVDAIRCYVGHQDIRDFSLIGHSFGGLIAMQLAIALPTSTARLLVVDALPFLGLIYGPDTTPATMEPLIRDMRERIIAMTRDDFVSWQDRNMQKLAASRGKEFDAAVLAATISDQRVVAEAMLERVQADWKRVRDPAARSSSSFSEHLHQPSASRSIVWRFQPG
jgi:pimeloyl-ACP methyl ester carboxylesterase